MTEKKTEKCAEEKDSRRWSDGVNELIGRRLVVKEQQEGFVRHGEQCNHIKRRKLVISNREFNICVEVVSILSVVDSSLNNPNLEKSS